MSNWILEQAAQMKSEDRPAPALVMALRNNQGRTGLRLELVDGQIVRLNPYSSSVDPRDQSVLLDDGGLAHWRTIRRVVLGGWLVVWER